MTVESEPGVVPMLAYADGAAAMDWLADVFGFRERLRMMEGNRLSQGEMETDFGRVLLASGPDSYEGPRRHSEHCDSARNCASAASRPSIRATCAARAAEAASALAGDASGAIGPARWPLPVVTFAAAVADDGGRTIGAVSSCKRGPLRPVVAAPARDDPFRDLREVAATRVFGAPRSSAAVPVGR